MSLLFTVLLIINILIATATLIYSLLPYISPVLKKHLKKERFIDRRFSSYITIFYAIFLMIILFLNYRYLLTLLPLWYVGRVYIALVRSIKLKKEDRKTISELQFLAYLSSFIFIVLIFVVVFALIYSQAQYLGGGYFTKGEHFIKLEFRDTIIFSGFNFFSMEYGGLLTQDLLTFVALVEVFTAQIVIITFVGILASILFDLLQLKKTDAYHE